MQVAAAVQSAYLYLDSLARIKVIIGLSCRSPFCCASQNQTNRLCNPDLIPEIVARLGSSCRLLTNSSNRKSPTNPVPSTCSAALSPSGVTVDSDSPYPMAMAAMKRLPASGRPTPQECRAVIEALAQLHGRPNRHQHSAGLQPGCELKEPHTVLDSLVRHPAVAML
jgi:hypothetical protein